MGISIGLGISLTKTYSAPAGVLSGAGTSSLYWFLPLWRE